MNLKFLEKYKTIAPITEKNDEPIVGFPYFDLETGNVVYLRGRV